VVPEFGGFIRDVVSPMPGLALLQFCKVLSWFPHGSRTPKLVPPDHPVPVLRPHPGDHPFGSLRLCSTRQSTSFRSSSLRSSSLVRRYSCDETDLRDTHQERDLDNLLCGFDEPDSQVALVRLFLVPFPEEAVGDAGRHTQEVRFRGKSLLLHASSSAPNHANTESTKKDEKPVIGNPKKLYVRQ